MRIAQCLRALALGSTLRINVGTVKSQTLDAPARLRLLLPHDADDLNLLGAVVD